ncbi:non-canonical purine NTP pyrophosphatase [Helicobacter sp. 23-1045]
MIIIFFSGNLHKAREIKAIFAEAEVRIYTEFMDAFEVVENGSSFAQNAVLKVSALYEKMINLAHLDSAILREFGEKKVVLMAEDSGICVDVLHGMPNIFSARFANLPKNFMDFHAFAEGNSKFSPSILDGDFKFSPSLAEVKSVCPPSLAEGVRGWVDSSDSENIARLINELKARQIAESSAKFVSCVACCAIDLSLRENNLPLQNARGGQREWVDSANRRISHKIAESVLTSSLRDSAIAESKQSKLNPCEAPKTRPLRGAKNREQTSSSASADFLLEAEKRGTPPKSEKRELLARRGSGVGGAALLRKDSSESNDKNGETIADSALDSANRTKIAESSDYKETIALTTHGFLNGKVICKIRGQNGFGYDPIFIPNGFDKTIAELPSEVKNALSHRRHALDLMRLLLK